ncbi:MAG: hypothetical protein QM578_09285 [Pantoea sp.]|uniref:hypothetical protein n=1 Tax=Pantoea sp. TaxID=69393 RepID=UPI0039E408D6
MDATISSYGFSNAFTLSVARFEDTQPLEIPKITSSSVVTVIKSIKTIALPSNLAYDHVNTLLVQQPLITADEIMTVPTSSPLTVGWAIGLTASLIVAALAIAGGTFSLLHSDINDVRADISSVRDGASSDNQALREDMRQDFSQLNVKLDKMSTVLTDIRVDQAKSHP